MKVLMLGWEYPPHLSGGLGTACEGLTRALARLQVELEFVVPKLHGGEQTAHLRMVDAHRGQIHVNVDTVRPESIDDRIRQGDGSGEEESGTEIVQHEVPAHLIPYQSPEQYLQALAGQSTFLSELEQLNEEGLDAAVREARKRAAKGGGARGGGYGGNLFDEVERYAASVIAICGNSQFDIIHAHDWMTFPAAMALKRLTGKPLVVHLHSLEYDRSGDHQNHQIQHIEGAAMNAADAVIAVSYYTRSIIRQQHHVALEKIHVVHNGVYPRTVVDSYRKEAEHAGPMVLFLGRITFQKGPEHFIDAAAKVLPHVPNASFVMAGAGDLLPRMRDRVRQLGLEPHFHFPGFLRGPEVEQMFSTADLYVMPSVSEPFGISALEAISFDTPVIISRQSGVAEVLRNALKVDFWDVDRLAELIIGVLRHQEVRSELVQRAREEVRLLRWDAAAIRSLSVYRGLLQTT